MKGEFFYLCLAASISSCSCLFSSSFLCTSVKISSTWIAEDINTQQPYLKDIFNVEHDINKHISRISFTKGGRREDDLGITSDRFELISSSNLALSSASIVLLSSNLSIFSLV